MSGEAEPRRSVRATKGQHTKAFDELEPAAAPKRRQTKKTKKALAQEQEQSQEPEEVIRCVCGATEQDEDSGEAWISCETCFVWQHNVCVGVSSYEDEIPENYWCEQCRPQNHKQLLDGIASGEKPWEARRKAHEEEAERKKRKGGRKKGKRGSDLKDELDKDSSRAKASPTPDAVARDKKEPTVKQGKRKTREDSHDADGKTTKMRRVSDNEAIPVSINYSPPEDLAPSIAELPGTRVGPAKALKKSLTHVITLLLKTSQLELPEDSTLDTMADTYALQIERAVFDTHPLSKGQKEYSQQIKSLSFNLKNNPELFQGLTRRIHSPMTLAVMTSEQLASAEMQRQTAEMKAKAEKQSILYTSETGPRVRRTHKGEEVVEDESMVSSEAPMPTAGGARPDEGEQTPRAVKRESIGGGQVESMIEQAEGGQQQQNQQQQQHQQHQNQQQHQQFQQYQQQQSPSQPNFDIGKVFSSVKSPTTAHLRRPSVPVLNTNGPGVDADVDRMLQDETESPPYSPTEETHDPDVIWRGSLAMSSIADFQATAKHVGGANFASFGPWSKLIPRQMSVAGRIPQQSAIEYLCGLRYSSLTDVIVVSITPESPDAKQDFHSLINYFVSKNRYGVVGNKVAGNVRDTYLVPVPAGEDGHPEFMLNLVDNYIPKSRSEPLLLAVFVYRHDPEQLKQLLKEETGGSASAPISTQAGPVHSPSVTGTPTPVGYAQRSGSASGPAFSPATPHQGLPPSFPPFTNAPSNGHGPSATPVPIPQTPHGRPAPGPQAPTPAPASAAAAAAAAPPLISGPTPALAVAPPPSSSPSSSSSSSSSSSNSSQMTDEQKKQAQEAGQVIALEVLGPLITVPTVQFILPQAFQMSRREWEVIRGILERDARARDDLRYLADLLEKEGTDGRAGEGGGDALAVAAPGGGGGGGPRTV